MKKTFLLITALALSLTAASAARIYTPEEIAAESKRANEFLDKCYDDFIALHPQAASRLGIKTNGTIFQTLRRRLTWPRN